MASSQPDTPWRLDLVRHGEVLNPRNILYGRLPRFGLSARGREQARAAARSLRERKPSVVFSSPLLRARQTAAEIALLSGAPRPKVSVLLNEVCSAFEGVPGEQVDALNGDVYTGAASCYEQPRDVLARLQKFIRRERRRRPYGPVAAVTHGDVIVFGVLWALGRDPLPMNKGKLLSAGFPAAYPAHASITSFIFRSEDPRERPEVSYLRPY